MTTAMFRAIRRDEPVAVQFCPAAQRSLFEAFYARLDGIQLSPMVARDPQLRSAFFQAFDAMLRLLATPTSKAQTFHGLGEIVGSAHRETRSDLARFVSQILEAWALEQPEHFDPVRELEVCPAFAALYGYLRLRSEYL